MAEAQETETTTQTEATTAQTTSPWYDGHADQDTIGYFKNRGWDADPVTAAIEASKAHRNAEKLLGGPADQLLRLPKEGDVDGWNSFYQRLGKPKDPAEYDFSDVTFADGSAIDQTYADLYRKVAYENNIPKDAAAAFARALAKQADAEAQADAVAAAADHEAALARLKQNWGENMNRNQLEALEGTRKLLSEGLGMDTEKAQAAYDAMAKAVGVDVVAEMFRQIGAGLREDSFHEGNRGGANTVEQAKSRKAELMADKDWMKRYTSGGAAERREMLGLNRIITGVYDAA